jgi:hypothetical protein
MMLWILVVLISLTAVGVGGANDSDTRFLFSLVFAFTIAAMITAHAHGWL